MELNFKWSLKDLPKKKEFKVFSTFACGGGSSMGYKLAGFDVIGANDIDDEMAEVYKNNHNPIHYFKMPIKDMLKENLPKEMYDLDILDGSPPCSTFSMVGSRDKNWGKDKKFREGQAMQVLDDLFFDFIEVAKHLQPKIVVAENVKGMLAGNAQGYLVQIRDAFDKAGYKVQLFSLNAATMGVPQKRERVFFLCSRKDLDLPNIKLDFNIKPILLKDVAKSAKESKGKLVSKSYEKYWHMMEGRYGSLAEVHPKGSFFSSMICSPNKVLNTIVADRGSKMIHWESPHEMSNEVLALCNTFPIDYDYLNVDPKYLIGMSVPPVMIAQIANQIKTQWLKRI
jgi:DNA (cytosine-5)-methyltransferase 1